MKITERTYEVVTAVLFVALLVVFVRNYILDSSVNPVVRATENRLITGSDAPPEESFAPPGFDPAVTDLEAAFASRTDFITAHEALFKPDYVPSEAVFLSIDPKRGWVSVLESVFSNEEIRSVPAIPSAAPAVAFPLLLLEAHFRCDTCTGQDAFPWNYDAISPEHVGIVPLQPQVAVVHWKPAEKRAEVVYNVTEFLVRLLPLISGSLTEKNLLVTITALNAKDFNLRWMMNDPQNSSGVSLPEAKQQLFIYDHLGPDSADGSAKNTYLGSASSIRNFRIESLPASASFNLWHWRSKSKHTPPADFVFVVTLV